MLKIITFFNAKIMSQTQPLLHELWHPDGNDLIGLGYKIVHEMLEVKNGRMVVSSADEKREFHAYIENLASGIRKKIEKAFEPMKSSFKNYRQDRTKLLDHMADEIWLGVSELIREEIYKIYNDPAYLNHIQIPGLATYVQNAFIMGAKYPNPSTKPTGEKVSQLDQIRFLERVRNRLFAHFKSFMRELMNKLGQIS